MHAVGRIAYTGLHRQHPGELGQDRRSRAPASCSSPAVNDLGGTLMDENISRAAGASHGQHMEEADFARLAESLGRPLEQRTTLYGRVVADRRRRREPDASA